MSVGKTGRPDGIVDTQRMLQQQSEATDLIIKKRAQGRSAEASAQRVEGEDTVTLSAGKVINAQEAARSARILEIKRLLETGQYNPPAEKVAESLSAHLDEEIYFETLLNPDGGASNEEDGVS